MTGGIPLITFTPLLSFLIFFIDVYNLVMRLAVDIAQEYPIQPMSVSFSFGIAYAVIVCVIGYYSIDAVVTIYVASNDLKWDEARAVRNDISIAVLLLIPMMILDSICSENAIDWSPTTMTDDAKNPLADPRINSFLVKLRAALYVIVLTGNLMAVFYWHRMIEVKKNDEEIEIKWETFLTKIEQKERSKYGIGSSDVPKKYDGVNDSDETDSDVGYVDYDDDDDDKASMKSDQSVEMMMQESEMDESESMMMDSLEDSLKVE